MACVVAETAVQAKDAAEAVELDIEELPAVTTPAEALQAGAPQIHDEAPGNLALDFHYGDAEAVKKAFAEAAHVTRLEIVSNRIVVNPDGAALGDRLATMPRPSAGRCTSAARA